MSTLNIKPWYKKWWGVLIIVFIIILLAIIGYIGILTLKFYRQIQLGDLPSEIQGQFTSANINPPKTIRKDLVNSASTIDDPSFGNPNAQIQIIEFADFECPYSKDESLVIRELQAKYPDKIHFIYRDFPLTSIHPNSFVAAEAANCASDQDKFWAMHDKLYANSNRLTNIDIKAYAVEIGLDITTFNKCFDDHKYKDEIVVDKADGIAAGVIGTPTFFINNQMISGAIPIELWEQIIARAK